MKNEKVMTESKLVDNIHTSTKGNQNKWFDGKYWYKADGLGYEGLAEFVVSSLLKYTNVPNYVEYSLIPLKYKNKAYIGCMSKNFLSEGRTVTLKKLISTYKNKNIYDELSKFETLRDKIKYVVDFVEDITEIKNFGQYLTLMLEIDAFFLNEDRHFNNVSFVVKDDGSFELCPLYDFGASLFSDSYFDYPIENTYEDCIKSIYAKPFSEDFDEQCDAAEQLYGVQFQYNFSMKEINEILEIAKEYYNEKIINRVHNTLSAQLHKYKVYQNENLKFDVRFQSDKDSYEK